MAPWRDPLVLALIQSSLAPLFALPAAAKLRAREEFAGVVENYRILPVRMVGPVAGGLPWLEVAVAAGLLVPPARPFAAAVAMGLLLPFLAAIAVNLIRGRDRIDCGCHLGGGGQKLTWWLVLRNAALAAAALWLALDPATTRPATLSDLLVGVLAAVAFALILGIGRTLHGITRSRQRASMLAKGS
jgi:hypothetical protein